MLLVYALLTRWLFIAPRRLAYEQAIARREAKEGGQEVSASVEEELANLPRVDAQTRRIFKSVVTIALAIGLYAIWGEAIPVVDLLQRVELYPKLQIIDPDAIAKRLEEVQGQVFVSLGHVAVALIIIAFTAIAVKNIPGLLEITILQRLPLDAGARFAASTLTRYAILIVGATLAFNAIGIGWSTVQWLAAALTFGLAFGLQEIFANFVAGLIVLVERPMRVGDIVTVANVTGRVTRIQMRATTILDWDRRELLVPNKEFITGSLINWTLTDSISRVVIPVGIAYGSDTVLARKILLEEAQKNRLVLKDPAPHTMFTKFGESSLDLELRIFIADREHWVEVVDSMHTQIDEAFKRAGIEIAFPQRDLHIRSAPGLDVQRERARDVAPERG
jgi:potassium efflux system protein